MNISGKIFIVTGASSGIGEVLSKKLAKKGAQIICASRNLEKLNRVVDEIEIQGGTAISIQTDITHIDQCQLLVEKTISRFGKLDALVLNAALSLQVAGQAADLIEGIEIARQTIVSGKAKDFLSSLTNDD